MAVQCSPARDNLSSPPKSSGQHSCSLCPTGSRITQAAPNERTEALSLLFRRHTASHRVFLFHWARKTYQADASAFDLLYVAKRGGRIRGVIWGRPIPGRLVTCWGPMLLEGESETTRSVLLSALDHRIAKSDAQLAHATLRPGSYCDLRALALNEFRYITDIDQMACILSDTSRPTTDEVLDFDCYTPAKADRLKSVIQRSEKGSLDCVAMRGVRHIDDVLEGHYRREGYEPSHWRIVRHGDRDVGCLLLSRNVQRPEFDVVYLCLVPEARGHGWGARVVRYAKRQASSAGAKQLLLTCDVTNPPALATYRQAGFREIDRWSVFIKDYHADAAPASRRHWKSANGNPGVA